MATKKKKTKTKTTRYKNGPAQRAKGAKWNGADARRAAGNGNGRSTTRAAGARSQTLPGMEQVRNRRLDNFCEAINDARTVKNAQQIEEDSAIQGSLREMHDKGVDVYKHAGVELARVPGTEKLRVRLTKDKGDAHVGTAGVHAENAGEGEGEDGGVDEPQFGDDVDAGAEG